MSTFEELKKKYNPKDVTITLVVQDTDTEKVILEKEINSMEDYWEVLREKYER